MTFGDAARRWTRHLSLPSDVLAVDPSGADAALAHALHCKRRGEPFRVAILLADERSEIAARLAPGILQTQATPEAREILLDALAAGTLVFEHHPMQQLRADEPEALKALHLIWWLASGAVARSHTEYARLARIFGREHARIDYLCGIDHLRLAPCSELGDRVVVWAPDRSAADCALIAYALEQLHTRVHVICADGSIAGMQAGFHTPLYAAGFMSKARAIVDASWSNPASARALAELGVPLAVASTSGAHEYLEGVTMYDPWDRRSILRAALAALAAPAPQARLALPRNVIDATPLPLDGPLVSVLVPTYNRRALLPRALESIRIQQYRALEVIVINDGGESIADIVAQFESVRCIEQPENHARGAALNAGLRQAQGEYVASLDDDDELFPDHIARAVAALERSRGDVAHMNTMLAFIDERGAIEGVSLGSSRALVPSEALVSFPLLGQFLGLVRRSLLETIGGFTEDIWPGEDYDFLLRLAAHVPFVHVPDLTALITRRSDNTNSSQRLGPDYEAMHREVYRRHPSGGRSAIESGRAVVLGHLATHRGLPPPACDYRFATPLAL